MVRQLMAGIALDKGDGFMKKMFGCAAVALGWLGLAGQALSEGSPVKIGVICPTMTLDGKQSMQVAQIAADVLNDAGGG